MKRILVVVVMVLAASVAPQSRAETSSRSPKVGDTYSCLLTFSVTVWTKTGVKEKALTEGPTRVLIKVLENELEKTSLFRNDPSVGHYPIASRGDDSVIAMNPVSKDGWQQPGRHTLFGLTDQVAVYVSESGGYRNGAAGITMMTQSGTCRKAR